MNNLIFFEKQREIIQTLLSIDVLRLAQKQNHIAYSQWELCNTIVNQGGRLIFPDQEDLLPIISKMLLDFTIFQTISGGDLQNITLGKFNLFNKGNLHKQFVSRLHDLNQYEDVLVELHILAWNLFEKRTIFPLSEDGFPDIKMEDTNLGVDIYIECKNLGIASEQRIAHIVKKANKQIKRAKKNSTDVGIVYIDISKAIPFSNSMDFNKKVIVKDIIKLIKKTISNNFNTSISAIAITWNDYIKIEGPKIITYAFRKRNCVLYHVNPLSILPKNFKIYEGYTTVFNIVKEYY